MNDMTSCRVRCLKASDQSLFPDSAIFKEDSNYELLGTTIGSIEFCHLHTQKGLISLRPTQSFGKVTRSIRTSITKALCVIWQTCVFSQSGPTLQTQYRPPQFWQCCSRLHRILLCCSFTDSEWSLAGLSTKMLKLTALQPFSHHRLQFINFARSLIQNTPGTQAS